MITYFNDFAAVVAALSRLPDAKNDTGNVLVWRDCHGKKNHYNTW